MLLALLPATLAIALLVAFSTARLFRQPIAAILRRLVGDELSDAWRRYISFAIYVVGVSGGVRVWQLEKYVNPRGKDEPPIVLNVDRWTLEVYRTVIETLQSIAWMLLVFFVAALIAYVLVRGFELRRQTPAGGGGHA
jgi:hypothetical protein